MFKNFKIDFAKTERRENLKLLPRLSSFNECTLKIPLKVPRYGGTDLKVIKKRPFFYIFGLFLSWGQFLIINVQVLRICQQS